MELKPSAKGGQVLDVQLVKNAYGKKHGLAEQFEKSDVMYLNPDKNRTNSWLQGLGLQLPSDTTRYGSIGSILYDGNYVKLMGVPYAQITNKEPSTRQTLHASVNQTGKTGKTNAQALINGIRDSGENSNRFSAKDSADIVNYTEKQYNKFGWACVNGIISAKENWTFYKRLSDKRIGAEFPRTSDGKYIFSVGDLFGVNNVLIVSDGNQANPSIEKVYRIAFDNETDIDIVRREVYEREKRDSARAGSYVQQIFTEELIKFCVRQDCLTYRELRSERPRNERSGSRENNRNYRFEQDGSRDSGKASRTIIFSLKDASPVDVSALQQENEKLAQSLDVALGQTKLTHGHRVKAGLLGTLAGKTVRDYKSEYSASTLKENLVRIFEFLSSSKNPNMNEVHELGVGLMKAVLEKSNRFDSDGYNAYSKARDYLRNTGIVFSDTQKKEAAALFDTFGEYRSSMFGSVKITTDWHRQ